MDEAEARAVLGVPISASMKECRKAHRDLAKMFHPDRHATDSAEDLARANVTMSRINAALDALVAMEAAGTLGRPASAARGRADARSSFEYRPRAPRADECNLCGSSPAAATTFRAYTGFLIWVTSHTFNGSFCKSCGTRLLRESQVLNLTRGWWGISIVPALLNILGNLFAYLPIRRLGFPAYRDPAVMAPFSGPAARGKAVAAHVSVWVASVVALALVSFLVAAFAAGPNTSQGGSTTTVPGTGTPGISNPVRPEVDPYLVGACWTAPNSNGQIEPVSCPNAAAAFVVVSLAGTQAQCPQSSEGSVSTDSGQFACLARKG